MFRVAVLVAIALLALVGASWAQQRDAPRCTWSTAEYASVSRLERSRTDFRGHCVRVRAELDGWKLSVTRSTGGGAIEYFIGAYSGDEALLRAFQNRPRRVEVLGVVGHCSDICANSPTTTPEGYTNVCMPVGFCHYYDDPYVMIEAVR
jgi:hypothetical protein